MNKKWKRPLKDVVMTVLRNHPKDCLFSSEFIEDFYKLEVSDIMYDDLSNIITAIKILFIKNEVYCEHEKIDRMDAFRGEVKTASELVEILTRSSMVEPAAHNRLVVGSIPTGSTNGSATSAR